MEQEEKNKKISNKEIKVQMISFESESDRKKGDMLLSASIFVSCLVIASIIVYFDKMFI